MEKVEQQNSPEEVAIIRELIFKHFTFLEQMYQYIPAFNQKISPLFIDSFEVKFTNESRRRELSVSYTKGKFEQALKYTITVTITRIPYISVKDFFSLDNYFKATGEDFAKSMINEFSATTAESILQKMAVILKTQAIELIEGKEWWEIYYSRRD